MKTESRAPHILKELLQENGEMAPPKPMSARSGEDGDLFVWPAQAQKRIDKETGSFWW